MPAQHLAIEENTLYAAVVALREGALLLRRMADEPGGQKGEELCQEGQKRQAHAEAIRQILNDSPRVTLDLWSASMAETLAETSLLIIDDDANIRLKLREIAEREGINVVGEAENGQQGLEEVARLSPAIILLDVSMPIMGGFAAARQLRESHPHIRIIFLSQYSQQIYAEEAVKLGAAGYVLKSAAVNELPSALTAIHAGEKFISERVAP